MVRVILKLQGLKCVIVQSFTALGVNVNSKYIYKVSPLLQLGKAKLDPEQSQT